MRVFRIAFLNQGKVYEIYAKRVQQGELYGFVEVHDLLFEESSTVLVDPSTERLKTEFKGVNRTIIPIHSVVRIDEVEKEGHGKIRDLDDESNVTPFPTHLYPPNRDSDK
ncbi:MAG: DUF1820 family protein [Pseudomonadota bacterium]|nr:DUF1820 family protein [Pseudomonadota bacterium]